MIDMTSYKAETRLRGMLWSKLVMSQVSKNQIFGQRLNLIANLRNKQVDIMDEMQILQGLMIFQNGAA